MNRIRSQGKTAEAGFVLIMALIFLLILTVIGVTAMSTTTLEEKMTGNLKDKDLAFQAAETSLISAETWMNGLISKPGFPDNAKGLYVPSTDGTPVWDTVDWTGADVVMYPCAPAAAAPCGTALTGITTQPKYIIEDLGEIPETGGSLVLSGSYKGKGSTVLRVTARGTGGSDNTQVIVQSVFMREF